MQFFFFKNLKKNSEIFFVNPAQEQIGNSNSTAFPPHNFPNHQIWLDCFINVHKCFQFETFTRHLKTNFLGIICWLLGTPIFVNWNSWNEFVTITISNSTAFPLHYFPNHQIWKSCWISFPQGQEYCSRLNYDSWNSEMFKRNDI